MALAPQNRTFGGCCTRQAMTKIKNFRIHLRPRELARWLKKERGMETTPDLELTIEKASSDSKRSIETAAIYTTLTRAVAEKTTPLAFPDKAIAVSVIVVSIGPALETQRLAAAGDEESLAAALQHEALTQSLQFVIRLVQEQAKEEDCEMSLPPLAGETPVNVSLATLLGVQRIGI